MPRPWTPLLALPCAALGLTLACADAPTGPDGEPEIRTVLLHFGVSGENRLWDTDGTDAGELSAASRGLLPIGAHADERVIALRHDSAIVLTTLDQPGRLDTALFPAPTLHTLASFSVTGDRMALVSYAPVAAVLVYDRANRLVDTIPLGGLQPVLPPVFGPDGTELFLFSLTDLSVLLTVVPLGGGSLGTAPLALSRFLNRPIFGWPRWVDDGLRMAFLRRATEGEGPDTLIVGEVYPDDPQIPMLELYRAPLAPEADTTVALEFDLASTYALSTDGREVILGAVPVGGAHAHGVFHVVAGAGRPRALVDTSDQFPMYPLFIRE
jgi:hypothetical protein